MIHISDADAKTLCRVLRNVQGMAGQSNKEKNTKRQAILLAKRIDAKLTNKWQNKG